MKRSVTAFGFAALVGLLGVFSCGSDSDCTDGTVRVEAIGDPAKLPAGGGIVTVQVEQNGTIVGTASTPLDLGKGQATVQVPLPAYRAGDEVIVRAHLADQTGRVVGTWFNLVKLASGCLSLEANLFLSSIPDGGVADASPRTDANPVRPDAMLPAVDGAPISTPDASVGADAAAPDADPMTGAADAASDGPVVDDASIDAP